MNVLFYLVIHTANILGIFTDPFEFEGDYGSGINLTRQKIFEQVVSKEALAKNLTGQEIIQLMQSPDASQAEIAEYHRMLVEQALLADHTYGPTLAELIPDDLIQVLIQKQSANREIGFSTEDLENFTAFIHRYGDQHIFHFLRSNLSGFLSLDKILRDHAARKGKDFDLPILGSTEPLIGQNNFELKVALLDKLMCAKTLQLAKPEETVRKSLAEMPKDFLNAYFGPTANTQDLAIFCTPAGQTLFYWLYHALNLHLISKDPAMITEINLVKKRFAESLANPEFRAQAFREKLIAANSGLLFTQESDAYIPKALGKENLFLPIDKQNPRDGCFIFLRTDMWEPEYEIIPIADYEGYKEGRLTVALATHKTGKKFLLASGHGHSIKAEDGRFQISLVMQKFQQLSKLPENKGLQLLIGIDANTKSEEDVKALREHLDTLGLIGTNVGPTTVKKRMVTTQHAKAGRFAIDEEDYLITLKPDAGGDYIFIHSNVGFSEEKPDVNDVLPNIKNPSDHYPVGATLYPLENQC